MAGVKPFCLSAGGLTDESMDGWVSGWTDKNVLTLLLSRLARLTALMLHMALNE